MYNCMIMSCLKVRRIIMMVNGVIIIQLPQLVLYCYKTKLILIDFSLIKCGWLVIIKRKVEK